MACMGEKSSTRPVATDMRGQRVGESIIHAGTTDSIAAFMATGASELGDAATSLGSTIALVKLLATSHLCP